MTTNGPVITARGLGKQYSIGTARASYRTLREALVDGVKGRFNRRRGTVERFWAIRDVSLDVQQGEVVGIIGRNGAGKSTLLKVLARITAPTEGYAEVRGRLGSLLEVGTGFHPELTGRENIFLSGAILGMSRGEVRRSFDSIVSFAEVERFVDTPVKHFSSGMYLRLAFAVAAHLETEILLVDEVLAVGDHAFQARCLGRMKEVSRAGRTVLFVSHNMGAVNALCTRCFLLESGRIALDGGTREVIDAYVSKGLANQLSVALPEDPEKPIHLRTAAVRGLGGEYKSEFRYDEGFRVDVEFEVREPVENASVWVGVRTVEGVWAFGTADSDADPAFANRARGGWFRTHVIVPPRFLNAGRYSVVVGISRLRGGQSYDRVELSTLTLLDVGVPEYGRPGIVLPLLPWKTEEIEVSKRT